MNNITIWLILVFVSIVFGISNRIAAHNENGNCWWFFEVWRDFVNYFISFLIGYFLVVIRWPYIAQSGNLSGSDFLLGLIFFVGILGWWPYFIKNVTEGIDAIITKILDKK